VNEERRGGEAKGPPPRAQKSGVNVVGVVPTESEVRLAVDVRRPEGVRLWRSLRRRARLGPYRLGPPARRLVRDVYWDTRDRALGLALVALRVRQVLGRALIITVKLPGSVAGNLTERPEFERELTPAAVAEVLGLIAPYLPAGAARGPAAVARDRAAVAALTAAFSRSVASAPLEPILTAHTRRLTRAVLLGDARRAELVMDRVTFFGARDQRLRAPAEHIVEVEAAALGSATDALAVESHVLALAAAAGPGGPAAVRGEPRSKLERGLALTGGAR